MQHSQNKLDHCRRDLDDLHRQVETVKQEVEKPFPQEQEFKEKSKWLAELDALLNMDERQPETMDEEPEKGDEQRKVQCAHLER